MKRPVTLLCLADLHLVDQQSPIITSLRSSIKELMNDDPIWRPDFLVIAGDLVEAKDPHYDLVKTHINSFISDDDFHLNAYRFIAAPGNHDKDFPFTGKDDELKEKLTDSEKNKYKDFVSFFDSDSFKFDIKDSFKDNFRSFGSFYRDYVPPTPRSDDNVEYYYPAAYLGADLDDVALTSGLKIFHDLKICFMSVNTEWVYLPEDSKTDSGLKKICPQVVIPLIEYYRANYRDYALVTVMHRSPYELSWTEKNSESLNQLDILESLYHYSDVILSGHDHIQKVMPPHMMENKAQMFQLGSASMGKRGKNIQFVRYLATLINMDYVEGTLKMCSFRYNHKEEKWKHQVDENIYPLSGKLAFDSEAACYFPTMGRDKAYLRMKVKSTGIDVLKQTIRASHPGIEAAGYGIVVHNINDSGLQALIEDAFTRKEKIAVFVYTHSDMDHKRFYELKTSLQKDENIRERMYLKELIIKEFCYSLSYKQPMSLNDSEKHVAR